MPGFSPQAVANKVQTGNSVLIQLGQQVIMFAQTVGYQLPMGAEHLFGIGSSKPQEIQQLRMSPMFNLDSFELTENGQTLLQGGQNLNYILAGNQFTMTVLDGASGSPLYVYVGAKCQNLGGSIPANAPVRDSYTFLALDVLNADGVSIMDTGDNALELASAYGGIAATGIGVGVSASVNANLNINV